MSNVRLIVGRAAVSCAIVLLVIICGCSRDDVDQYGRAISNSGQDSELHAADEANLKILFIGNSHTSANGLPTVVGRLLQAGDSSKKVHVRMCVGGFLAHHAQSKSTREAIAGTQWNYVVLQAQKYSTSGNYSYPYDGAIEISKLARDVGAEVVMYPEWRRRGHLDEGRRIHKLHQEIAAITGAKVAPVGLAWDQALAERPKLQLHGEDGNHSAPWGAYLTAVVFYSVLTERSPDGLPGAGIDMPDDVRSFLQDAAWETVRDQAKAENEQPKPDSGEAKAKER